MMAGLRGDAGCHRELLQRLSRHLRAYFRGKLLSMRRSPAEAEDLVQETLIAIHTRRHTYDPNCPLTPWIYAIARYKLIDHTRRTKIERVNVSIKNADEVPARDDYIAAESVLDLNTLLARLPAKMRSAIQNVKLEGLSVSESATRQGMSESAVKVSIHRGMKALSTAIGERGKK